MGTPCTFFKIQGVPIINAPGSYRIRLSTSRNRKNQCNRDHINQNFWPQSGHLINCPHFISNKRPISNCQINWTREMTLSAQYHFAQRFHYAIRITSCLLYLESCSQRKSANGHWFKIAHPLSPWPIFAGIDTRTQCPSQRSKFHFTLLALRKRKMKMDGYTFHKAAKTKYCTRRINYIKSCTS